MDHIRWACLPLRKGSILGRWIPRQIWVVRYFSSSILVNTGCDQDYYHRYKIWYNSRHYSWFYEKGVIEWTGLYRKSSKKCMDHNVTKNYRAWNRHGNDHHWYIRLVLQVQNFYSTLPFDDWQIHWYKILRLVELELQQLSIARQTRSQGSYKNLKNFQAPLGLYQRRARSKSENFTKRFRYCLWPPVRSCRIQLWP